MIHYHSMVDQRLLIAVIGVTLLGAFSMTSIYGNDDDTLYCGEPISYYTVIEGTDQNDTLYGIDNTNDLIFGYDGNDTIYGGDGDDCIFGGDGKDELYGNDGDDKLYGGSGNDKMYGGEGDDTCFDNSKYRYSYNSCETITYTLS